MNSAFQVWRRVSLLKMNPRNLAVIFAVLFILLALVVKVFGEDFPLNSELFTLINGAQATSINPIMVAASKYGAYLWIPVTALIWILGRGEMRRAALLLAAGLLLGLILMTASKLIINAPRPEMVLSTAKVLIAGETDASYPSGTTTIVSIGAILSLTKLSRRVSWPLTLEALLVSFSRIYVGVHWPIDILGGWLLGGFCTFIVLFIESRRETTPVQDLPGAPYKG